MESFKAVSRYMQESPTFNHDMWFIVVAAAGLGLLWLGITLWDRYQAVNAPDKPRYETLFVELCQVHKLAEGESRWLEKLAVQNGFDDPARVFIAPSPLEAETRAEGEDASIARALLHKLFGGDAATEA